MLWAFTHGLVDGLVWWSRIFFGTVDNGYDLLGLLVVYLLSCHVVIYQFLALVIARLSIATGKKFSLR